MGIPKDPVTGSINATLVPYWAEQLGETQLRVSGVSLGGLLKCEMARDRVLIVDVGWLRHRHNAPFAIRTLASVISKLHFWAAAMLGLFDVSACGTPMPVRKLFTFDLK